MPRVPLIGQSYQGKSVIASGQECLNLYGEINQTQSPPGDPQAPAPVTFYPFAGTRYFTTAGYENKCRGFYATSKNTAYVVIGPRVYFLAANRALVLVGTITDRPSQVSMYDNGLCLVIVDGSNEGWAVNLADNVFGQIIDASFYGADFVNVLDTFFVFNRPATNQFYISLSNVTFAMLTGGIAFDPLDIAAKAGFSDNIVGIAVAHRELWLIGRLTSEVWIGTGAADFYFQQVQGAFINHGCAAQHSIATQDILVFFIMQDQQGSGIVVQGGGYELKEISTPRIVQAFKSYVTMADAVGGCFQLDDHAYYAVIFPTANQGWLYDLKTGWWLEWNWLDPDTGILHRPRANCFAFAYGYNLTGDFENGTVHELDPNCFTDSKSPIVTAGPITRIKTFPHIIGPEFERVQGLSFDADMEVGTTEDLEENPEVSLSWSDDRGVSYGNALQQSLGRTGEYLTTLTWNRLGQARDRVYKLQWSAAVKTALNGAFIKSKAART